MNTGGGFGNPSSNLLRDLSKFGLDDNADEEDGEPFPCHIATSTIPRACQTVAWKDMPSKALSNFNPIDKGEFTGLSMEDIAQKDPEWYEEYENDPFYTRYVLCVFLSFRIDKLCLLLSRLKILTILTI